MHKVCLHVVLGFGLLLGSGFRVYNSCSYRVNMGFGDVLNSRIGIQSLGSRDRRSRASSV